MGRKTWGARHGARDLGLFLNYVRIDGRGMAWADHDGRVERLAGTMSNITQQRQLEEQLLHAQKMDGLGRVAGAIAHDFNNLLMVISAGLDMLHAADEDRAEALRGIQRATDRASSLAQRLLTVARRDPYNPTLVELNRVIADVTPLIGRLLGSTVRTRLELDARDIAVRADLVHIEEMLLNLAANARDAMPEGGSFAVRTSLHEGDAVIEMIDSGCGMHAADLARVFDLSSSPERSARVRAWGSPPATPSRYGRAAPSALRARLAGAARSR